MNIILCGMPMCGKTTLGFLTAQKLGWKFIDTDRVLEKKYEKAVGEFLSCREIAIQLGDQGFRKWENFVVEGLQNSTNCVIATGGGTVCDIENTTLLKSIGILIYLQVSLDKLVERLKRKPNVPAYLDPLDPVRSLEDISKRRCPIYEKVADMHINLATKKKPEVISMICASVNRRSYGKQ